MVAKFMDFNSLSRQRRSFVLSNSERKVQWMGYHTCRTTVFLRSRYLILLPCSCIRIIYEKTKGQIPLRPFIVKTKQTRLRGLLINAHRPIRSSTMLKNIFIVYTRIIPWKWRRNIQNSSRSTGEIKVSLRSFEHLTTFLRSVRV